MKEEKKINKHILILYSLAFVFLLASTLVMLFNIVDYLPTNSVFNLKNHLYGINLLYKNPNLFVHLIFLLNIYSLIFILLIFYFKKLKHVSNVLSLISLVMFSILPQLLSSPNPFNDGASLYNDVSFSYIGYIFIVLNSLGVLCLFGAETNKNVFSIKSICEIAVLIAMSLALSYIKIPLGATGGSLNFQFVPLVIISLRYSPYKSFIAGGIVYGLISCLLDNYGIFTYPMEYLVAFGSIFIISIFRNKIMKKNKPTWYGNLLIVLLISVITLIRLFAASIDSYVFYLNYLDEQTFSAAIIYNTIYVIPTGFLTIISVLLLYQKPLFILNNTFPSSDLIIENDIKITQKEKLTSIIKEEIDDYLK